MAAQQQEGEDRRQAAAPPTGLPGIREAEDGGIGRNLSMRKAALTVLAFTLGDLTVPAQAVELPATAPLPQARPSPVADTAALTAFAPFATRNLPFGEVAPLKTGLSLLSAGDIAAARALCDELPPGSLERRIIAWAIALSGAPSVSSREITRTMEMLPDWPGLERLAANRERALYREHAPAREVLTIFEDAQPVTFEGKMALARALMETGNKETARAVIAPVWREEKLEARQESALLAAFGSLLSKADHRHRVEAMLYAERVRAAERAADKAGAEALTKAWAAVIRDAGNAAKLLEAVPEEERSAGWHFAKARHLRRKGEYLQAAKVLLAAPRSASAQIDTDAWWFERRVLSRELLDIGEAALAYRVAAEHSSESAVSIADAEFHAGWYALRSLGKPETAARHFARILTVADGPISRARAFYWLGRAAEAGGPGEAEAFYAQAAGYPATFYGQLATARLGRDTLALATPEPATLDRRNFGAREAVHAIRRLEHAGYERYADILYRDLAAELSSRGELALLTGMAEERGDHHLALSIAKTAAARGIDVGALAHPLGAIPDHAAIAGDGKALAYAVARQESAFNAAAVSSAGARGLLQLMPATARAIAKKSGLDWSPARLTSDAGYNAALGAAYLAEQLDRFGGSYILTFIGYNAGPRRAENWIARYGDPRGKPVEEIVDWIERIPFTETRNYVQRVMENLQVYRMRLTGRFDIEGDLAKGG